MKRKFFIFFLVISAILMLSGCIEKQAGDKVCKLEVECLEIFENRDDLKKDKEEIIPKDGYFIKFSDVYFSDGESVMDVLSRELKKRRIPISKSGNYIGGINNLYAGDCGEMSGWIYMVNGESPMVDMENYKLKEGDEILVKFICSWE